MRDLYMMTCGHVSNGTRNDGKPVCAICGCAQVVKPVEAPTEGLEGRRARCSDCGTTTESKWTLPFFKYQPEQDTDRYYCGCYGWD